MDACRQCRVRSLIPPPQSFEHLVGCDHSDQVGHLVSVLHSSDCKASPAHPPDGHSLSRVLSPAPHVVEQSPHDSQATHCGQGTSALHFTSLSGSPSVHSLGFVQNLE